MSNHALQSLTDRLGGRIAYGGDYNPEQWPASVWAEDAALMREAGVNLVTLGVFSWAWVEPTPGTYTFDLLDTVLDLLHQHGIAVDLATGTAAPPPWFATLHPHAMPMTADGVRLSHGSRQGFCPSSSAYADAAHNLVTQLAVRYADHPAVVLWHVHNEWGNHNAHCFCDASAEAFRVWLRERYGSLDELNRAWGTAFWSQRYSSWEQILPPRATPAFANPTQQLDHWRFSSDALLSLHRAECAILRRLAPDIPITTNLMGTLEKKVDGHSFARECDFVSIDHYLTAADPEGHIGLSFDADLARGMAEGAPWLLMEHSTSAVNWQPRNIAKTAGQMRRNSLTHLARGADGIMYFQWRQSKAGAEKWHSAMLPHAGTSSKTWHEVTALGADLQKLAPVRGTRVEAEAAILFDWQTWWALELDAHPSVDVRYLPLMRAWYQALWTSGIACDVVHPSADLSRYRLVLVPSQYLVADEHAAALERYVSQGGHVVVGFFSGLVDPDDQVRLGGHPGAYRNTLGLRVDEFHPLRDQETLTLDNGAHATIWSESIVLEDAQAWAAFAEGPLCGEAAITRNVHGKGVAWYIATLPEKRALTDLLHTICAQAGLAPVAQVPEGVEVVRRTGPRYSYLFVINHTQQAVHLQAEGTELLTSTEIHAGIVVSAGDVAVVQEVCPPSAHQEPQLESE